EAELRVGPALLEGFVEPGGERVAAPVLDAGLEVTRGAGDDAVAAGLHVPEEGLAEAHGSRPIVHVTAEIRRLRDGAGLGGQRRRRDALPLRRERSRRRGDRSDSD